MKKTRATTSPAFWAAGNRRSGAWADSRLHSLPEPHETQPSDSAVGRLAAPVSGKHSRRNGNRGADNQRDKGELKRCGIALQDNLAHRRLKLEGLPKIAASELPQVVSILDVERQIQPQYMTQLSQLSRCRTFTQHLLDRIARHDVDHEKDEREDEPECREREKKSFAEVAHHLR